jgi:G3E family GTPase
MSFLLLIGILEPTFAAEPGPVCREPSVVDEMTREIRSQIYYSVVDPKLVTEHDTSNPLIVRCQVCVQSVSYGFLRFDDKPLPRCLAHEFEVRIVTSGFVVRDLR